MEKERSINEEALEIRSKGSEITVALLWKATIIIYMNADCDIKMTEKETAKLNGWKRWNALMKMLKAIHREVEPLRKERRNAFDSL